MPVNQVQKLINAIDNNKTEFTYSPVVSKKLRELVKIPEPEKKLADELKQTKDEIKQQIKDELKQTKDELQQQMKNIQELLNSFIQNNSNVKD